MSLSMTREERERFLAETHVAVVSVAEEGRGPLVAPVWYRYAPGGELRFVTGRDSRKARLLRRAGRIGLCVQTETAPYRYVSIEGPVVFGEPDFERDVREVAIRYLGEALGAAYLAATQSEGTLGASVVVRVQPERWLSVDYRKMGGA